LDKLQEAKENKKVPIAVAFLTVTESKQKEEEWLW
jgi:hypothetical protein